MKSFFKYTLATIVGVIISALLVGIILFGAFGAVISSATSEKEVSIDSNSLLVLNLDKTIVDRGTKDPFQDFNFRSFRPREKIGLNQIVRNIEKAAEDDDIEGIVLSLSSLDAGYGQTEEINEALQEFKRSDKYVLSYANNYSQKSYYLATAADSIYMHPEGKLSLKGLRAELMFFKNLFDKIGVQPNIIKHGKYKSAVEPFVNEKMSEANREQIDTYLGAIWGHITKTISQERGFSKSKLTTIVDNLNSYYTEDIKNLGLVDNLLHQDKWRKKLKNITDVDTVADLNTVSLSDYDKVPASKIKEEESGLAENEIAVIYASGQIVPGQGDIGEIGSEKYAGTLKKARKDDDIKAIVLRVNSPGGSALASDIIWRETVLAMKEKPLIVSMGNTAASGGYYISCAADTIVANSSTITGSIGVFGMHFNVKKLLNKKLGITIDQVKTNEHADLGSFTRELSEKEYKILKDQIDDVYETFVTRVANGRNMDTSAVNTIAQGRVWTGKNAKQNGLVDVLGSMDDAVEIAANKADVEDYRITELPEREDPIKKVIEELTGQSVSNIIEEEVGVNYRYIKKLKHLSKMKGVQARLPYFITIN